MTSIMLALTLVILLLAFNTSVFSSGDHGHDEHGAHAAPRPGAIGDWAPWAILFRLAASIAACSFTIGVTLFSTDPSTPLLWTNRALLAGLALKGLVGGVVVLGVLTTAQLAMNAAEGIKR